MTALRSDSCQSDPCRVPIGGHASVELDFLPNHDASNVSIQVFASVFGFELALPLEDTDACAAGRLQCPIKAGEAQTLRYDLKIDDSYYPVSGDVGFRLVREDETPIACATISAELYSPEQEADAGKKADDRDEVDDHQEL